MLIGKFHYFFLTLPLATPKTTKSATSTKTTTITRQKNNKINSKNNNHNNTHFLKIFNPSYMSLNFQGPHDLDILVP